MSDLLTATETIDRLREEGHDVGMRELLNAARSGNLDAATEDAGAWMFDADADLDELADAVSDAPDGSLDDRFEEAQEDGRKRGQREEGGSLSDLRDARSGGLTGMGGAI